MNVDDYRMCLSTHKLMLEGILEATIKKRQIQERQRIRDRINVNRKRFTRKRVR